MADNRIDNLYSGTQPVVNAGGAVSEGFAYAIGASATDAETKALGKVLSKGFGSIFTGVSATIDYQHYTIDKNIDAKSAATIATLKAGAGIVVTDVVSSLATPFVGIPAGVVFDYVSGALIDNTIDKGIVNTVGMAVGTMWFGPMGYLYGGDIADQLYQNAASTFGKPIPDYRDPSMWRSGLNGNLGPQGHATNNPYTDKDYPAPGYTGGLPNLGGSSTGDPNAPGYGKTPYNPLTGAVGSPATSSHGADPTNNPNGSVTGSPSNNSHGTQDPTHPNSPHTTSTPGSHGTQDPTHPNNPHTTSTPHSTGNNINGSNTGPVGPFRSNSGPSTSTSHPTTSHPTNTTYGGSHPIILDLAGTGINITEASRSNVFMDSENSGLKHRTAWAGVGSGVLFIDLGGVNDTGDGMITQKREYVFTEWDPTAKGDLEALRNVFDSNGDGKLDASDAKFALFKVMVTNADGSQTAMTLTQLGITSIDLKADLTDVQYTDGSEVTGQTTFTRSNGTTGTVANTVLATDPNGYAVTQTVTTDASLNRIVTNTAYAADGSIANVTKSVTSADGKIITITYDNNGDGIIDKSQSINTTVDGAGTKNETLTNRNGGGVLINTIQTITSMDGKSVTINRDSTGGGWFDQQEVRTTFADGHRTLVITDKNADGTEIHQASTTVSIDGLVRSVGTDLDSNGVADLIVTDTLVNNADGSRYDTRTVTGNNGTVANYTWTSTASNGKTTTVNHDFNGDGLGDLVTVSAIVADAVTGISTSTIRDYSQDGTYLNGKTVTTSANGLLKTTAVDLNGDYTIDQTIVDNMVINADKSRDHVVSSYSNTGVLLNLISTHINSDLIGKTIYADMNGNGVYEHQELVSVDAAGIRTDTTLNFTDDGTAGLITETNAITSADGLSTTTYIVLDGNNNVPNYKTTDVTVHNGDGTSVRQLSSYAYPTSTLFGQTTETTSANGLIVTTKHDIDGAIGAGFTTSTDYTTEDKREVFVDLSTRHTMTTFNGDNTLHDKTVIDATVDRRTVNITVDRNGDGFIDQTESSVTALNGTITDTVTNKNKDQSTINQIISTTSANGLLVTTTVDKDGNGSIDLKKTDVTAYSIDGSTTETIENRNNDNSLRDKDVVITSTNGLVVSSYMDLNGDGVTDRIVQNLKSTDYLGGTAVVAGYYGGAYSTGFGWDEIYTSANGLTKVHLADVTGDNNYDFYNITTTTVSSDGSTHTVTNNNNYYYLTATYTLLSSVIIDHSADGRSTTISIDRNADGHNDQVETIVTAATLQTTDTVANLNADGTVQSRTTKVTAANGLSSTISYDYDGNGTTNDYVTTATVINVDGSKTTTTNGKTVNSVTNVDKTTFTQITNLTASGLKTTIQSDSDGNGTFDTTRTDVSVLLASGAKAETITDTNNDLSTRGQTIFSISADQLTATTTYDVTGDKVADKTSTRVVATNGLVTDTITTNYTNLTLGSVASAIKSTFITTTSANGLVTTYSDDRNGDGIVDLSSNATTVINANGSKTTTTIDRGGGPTSAIIDQHIVTVSANGYSTAMQDDRNGDGTYELLTSDNTVFNVDGSTTRSISVSNVAASTTLRDKWVSTTNGNGLSTTTTTDFNGDGTNEHTTQYDKAGDSSWVETNTFKKLSGTAYEIDKQAMSADGRLAVYSQDLDGSGTFDRIQKTTIDLNSNYIIEYKDQNATGVATEKVIVNISANQLTKSASFDTNADGTAEFIRTDIQTYATNGQVTDTFNSTYANVLKFYTQTTVTDAGANHWVRSIDYLSNGSIEEKVESTHVILANGIDQTTVTTTDALGKLVDNTVTTISANGLNSQIVIDNNGDTKVDRTIVTTVGLDGSKVTSNTEFTNAVQTSQVITSISSDGLNATTSYSNGSVETTRQIFNSMGSYVWTSNDGSSSTHTFDNTGVDTWKVVVGGINYSTTLDKSAEQNQIQIAERIFDTALDRNMYDKEYETLGKYIVDGTLNKTQLINDILISVEFTSKYQGGQISGTSTASQLNFIDQFYLNAFGRDSTAQEELTAKLALAGGGQTLAGLVASISESSEHIFVGTDHIVTNNTVLNLGGLNVVHQSDHTLDSVNATNFVKNIFDALYDGDPTANQLAQYTTLILNGTTTKWDIVQKIMTDYPLPSTTSPADFSLSNADFVCQLYVNAFARLPTATEQTQWVSLLASNAIDKAALTSLIGYSLDHQQTGFAHGQSTQTFAVNESGLVIHEVGGTLNFASGLTDVIDSRGMTVNLSTSDNITLTGLDSVWISPNGSGSTIYMNVNDTVIVSNPAIFDNVVISYELSTAGVNINLATGVGTGGYAQGDSVSGVYRVNGSSFDDVITCAVTTLTVPSIVNSGGGNDIIIAGAGWDIIDGGAGIDTVSYVASTSGVIASLVATGSGGYAQADNLLTGVESLAGSNFNDTLTGNAISNTLDGAAGNDLLIGGAGADVLIGGAGADTADYSLSNSSLGVTVNLNLTTAQASNGDASGDVLSGVENLIGSWGDDTLTGDANANVLDGLRSNSLFGDILIGGAGADTLKNGTASYVTSAVGVTANLSLTTAQVSAGDAAGDIYVNIGNITGSAFNDTLTGDTGANVIDGGAGDDAISGGGGNNRLYGGAGNDVFYAGAGVDAIDGGIGIDNAYYYNSVLGVNINLATGVVSGGDAQGDSLISIELVYGSSTGNNILVGDASDNYLAGFSGNDTISGGAGSDQIDGGMGTDVLDGGTGFDYLYYWRSVVGVTVNLATGTASGGEATGDTFSNFEAVIGSAVGDNNLTGDANANTLYGYAGNDTFNGGAGGDYIDGGTGNNTASYAGSAGNFVGSTTGVTVDLTLTTVQVSAGDASYDILRNIQNLIGSSINDTLTGDANVNILDGAIGDDSLYGGAGNDTLLGSAGNDWLDGGAGADVLNGGVGYDSASYLYSSVGVNINLATGVGTIGDAQGDTYVSIEYVYGSSTGNNILVGDANDNYLAGFSGNDTISGGAGSDQIDGGVGTDVLDGGAGFDYLYYNRSTTGVTVNLATNTASGGEATGDIFSNFEGVIGSYVGDNNLTGDVNANVFYGYLGNDLFNGGAGADYLVGGAGINTSSYLGSALGVTVNLALATAQVSAGDASGDTLLNVQNLIGSSFNDTLMGDSFVNVLNGGLGDDILIGGGGADTLIGGGGIDTASYANTSAVVVSLALATAQVSTGDASGDILSGISNLTGSNFADTLTGDANVNTLNGGLGNDILIGGAGADTLIGGGGVDTISYTTSSAAVVVNLGLATAQVSTGDASGDILSGISNLTGSSFNDILISGAGANTLIGGGGVDTASYAGSTIGVTVNLALATAQVSTGDASGDILSGISNLTGSNLADTLTGDANANTLNGGLGNDILIGGAGADTLIGGGGGDTASYAGSTTGVTVNLSVATAQISTGDASGDVFVGISNITGSSFDDILMGDANANALNGALGIDTVSYASSTAGVTINLALGTAQISGGYASGDILTGIEKIIGSTFNDVLRGSAGGSSANVIDGGAGDDILFGGTNVGGNIYIGGVGIDTLNYSLYGGGLVVDLKLSIAQFGTSDIISACENVVGTSFNDRLYGDSSSNVLDGGSGIDTLDGGAGNDVLLGRDGNDTLIGGAGADQLDGGLGSNTASYLGSTTGVTVNLTLATQVSGGDASGDTLSSIQSIIGSDFADTLIGDANANSLDGGAGDDILIGGVGADFMTGGLGIDTANYASSAAGITVDLNRVGTAQVSTGDASGDYLSTIENLIGTAFKDNLYGDANVNTIDGGSSDDTVSGGGGADILIGGLGSDTASYINSALGVTVNLSLITAQISAGDASGDVLSGFENLLGSTFNDILTGDSNSNVLTGGTGADTLIGGLGLDTASYTSSAAAVTVNLNLASAQVSTGDASGDILTGIENLTGSTYNDTLVGDSNSNVLVGYFGNDTLTGGLGNDTFVFSPSFGKDIISDFSAGLGATDVMQFSLGTAFDTYAEVIAAATQVGADTLITISANDTITLTNVLKSALVADDFLYV
jgi:Ca2+-binding RTX toxin-like protein